MRLLPRRRRRSGLAAAVGAACFSITILGLAAPAEGVLSESPARVAGSGVPSARALAAGAAHPISPALFGLNAVNFNGPLWTNPALDKVLADFSPGYLRYPGGTVANYWVWRTGWWDRSLWSPRRTRIDDGLSTFAAAVRATSAQVMFDLNVLSFHGRIASAADNPAMQADQMALLHDAAAAGIPVRSLELGNELYVRGDQGSTDYEQRFPSGTDYAIQSNTWIARLRATFPGAKFAVVGNDPTDTMGLNQRRLTWNAQVRATIRGADAITMHDNQRIYDPTLSPDEELALPYLHYVKVAPDLASMHKAGLNVWVNAFNLADMTRQQIYAGRWLHGLFVGAKALLYLRDGNITHLGPNATMLSAHESIIYDSANAFGSGGPRTIPLALGPVGMTLRLVQRALNGATGVGPVTFAGGPELGATHTPGLIGVVAQSSTRRQLVLTNLTGQPVQVSVGGVLPGTFTGTQLTAAASVTAPVTGPSSITATALSGRDQLVLAPRSFAYLAASG